MSQQSPVVTVIIPTYNSSGTLKLSLESVIMQDFSDFEVWIVGDGCSDDSEKVVASFDDDRLHWTNLPKNTGTPSAPRNEALRHAKGRFIAYLGHDDLWFPWHLSELVSFIEQENFEFVCSLGAVIVPEGVAGFFSLPEKARIPVAHISPSNWLHKSGLMDKIGLWSLDTKVGDDFEFLQSLWMANVRLGFRQALSVLKFPSIPWQMYSLSSDFPQTKYLQAMRQDPKALRLDLLMQYASVVSQRSRWLRKDQGWFRAQVHVLIEKVSYLYGRHRWPLNHLLYRRWRRKAGLSGKHLKQPNE